MKMIGINHLRDSMGGVKVDKKINNKTAKSLWWGESRLLDAEEELKIVDIIMKGKEYFDIDDSKLNKKEKYYKKSGIEARNRLVEAYSPLIEKIAREKYNSSESDSLTYNDFISEALITALQCAKNFDPYKSKKIIRFSNYVSRPVSSSLYRMSTKSKPQVSTPISVISKAKKWSHTYFDMLNKGLKVTDEEVSSISGVEMTQREVFEILDLSTTVSIEDIDHPSIQDDYVLEENEYLKNNIVKSIENIFLDDSDKALTSLGLKGGNATFSPFLLATSLSIDSSEAKDFLNHFYSILNHPIVRMSIKNDLEKYKK